jgi:hypothetical protein
MNKLNNMDTLDEALRIIYLESAKESEYSETSKEMEIILASEGIQMNPEAYDILMKKLSSITSELSFGQVLQQAIVNAGTTDEAITESLQFPVNVIVDLKKDTIYTNNVPIVLFKNLLVRLNISFQVAERGIRKTFDILKSQISLKEAEFSGFTPAFRKGFHSSRESIVKTTPRSDGKELFENKEALDKYLERLHELMK